MLLLPNVVGPQYILTIQVLPNGVTLYRRPTVRQYREHLATINCVVPACGREWRIGIQFGIECGEPIKWRALADLVQQLPAWTDQPTELMRRYGLSISLVKYVTRLPMLALGHFQGHRRAPGQPQRQLLPTNLVLPQLLRQPRLHRLQTWGRLLTRRPQNAELQQSQ